MDDAEDSSITGTYISNNGTSGGMNATGRNLKNTLIDLNGGEGFYGSDHGLNKYVDKRIEIYTSETITGKEKLILEVAYYNNEPTQPYYVSTFTATI